MIDEVRRRYNESFTEEAYVQFIKKLDNTFKHKITFRVAESPVFIDRSLKKKLIKASDEIIDFIVRDDFKALTEKSIPPGMRVPNETDHTLFLALDYALIKDQNNELQPRLIEMQGFPSLYGFQDFLAGQFKENFYCPDHFTSHFELSEKTYRDKLTRVLLNGHLPEHVILLEIDPLSQNTSIDFVITEKLTGITPVHIGDVEREGRKLFYRKNGQRVAIHRIYNRVIFDELVRRTDLKLAFNLTEDVEVEWAGHPNWFFRISKYAMPFLKSEYVPACRFLHEFNTFPTDLENYVLKPLFSFSGSGVIFHVTKADLDAIPIENRSNFMLQRKVSYEPIIEAPDGKVKVEVRLLFIWEEHQPRPTLVTNLARLSRGEMIGVKFNKDKTWVGGSVCFFEP